MTTKICVKCGASKPPSAFFEWRRKCRACVAEQQRAFKRAHPDIARVWRARATARESRSAVTERARAWRRANPEKLKAYRARRRQTSRPEVVRAQRIIANEIQRGRLVRPDTCAKCGAHGRIEASHFDYREPLRIEWLCVHCHRRKDRGPALVDVFRRELVG